MNAYRADSGFIIDGKAPKTEAFSDLRLIAESGNGWCRVYRCIHHGRRVALKVLKSEYAATPVFIELLRKEYELVKDLNHPCIAKVYSLEEVPGIGTAIMMEYVDGLPLDVYSARHPELSKADIRKIVNDLGSALDYIHARRIIHRDIKPSNILAGNGFVKLIDFGLGHHPEFTDYGYPAGTPAYTPDEPATSLSDIYSFGVTLRECFGGRWKKLDRAIAKAVNEKSDMRPQSCAELAHMLDTPASTWKFKAIFATVIVLLALAVGGGIFSLLRNGVGEDSGTAESTLPTGTATLDKKKQITDSTGTISEDSPSVIPSQVRNSVIENRETGINEDLSALPIEEAVYRVSLEAARKRFEGQLALWDTLSCPRSRQLAEVGHWRCLV